MVSPEPRGKGGRNHALGPLLGRFFSASLASFPLHRPFIALLLPRVSPPIQIPPPKQGMSTEGNLRLLQPGRLPRRVGQAGVARRGDETRHFSLPSTCPTSAPGLGLRLTGASVLERQNHARRSPRVGKRGPGGRAGCLAGAFPQARPPPSYIDRVKKTGRACYI